MGYIGHRGIHTEVYLVLGWVWKSVTISWGPAEVYAATWHSRVFCDEFQNLDSGPKPFTTA